MAAETGYKHGIYTSEVPTTIIPTISVTTPTVVFGTAPIHLATDPAPANSPVLCHTLAEFVQQFGWSDDFDKYTLCEAAQVHLQLFSVAPVVFVNVLDADKHSKESTATVEGVSNEATLSVPMILSTLKVTTGEKPVEAVVIGIENTDPITIPAKIDAENFKVTSGDTELKITEDYTVASGKITLTEDGLSKINGSLTFTSGGETFAELIVDIDYTAAYNSKGEVVLTVVNTDKVVDDKISLTYNEIDASLVTESDIIGGVDITTGKNTGLELVEEVYPRFGLIPGQLIAPKYSSSSVVAAMLKAKCSAINGVFKALAIADISTSKVRKYTGVNLEKNGNNFVDPFLVATYPKVALGGTQYHLSTQLAALMCKVDAEHDDIPYKSPSNESLQCDQTVLSDGTDIFLGKAQANYLNGQGIVTALNFVGGWRCWGNRTSAYPANTDPKDSFIPVRRMFNWIANTLVTSFWSKIDEPINKRLIESVVDSANIWLNGLTARGALVGGRVEVLDTENPETDLLDGIIRFHVYIAPPTPAREISFVQEYDPSYLAGLFE